MSLTALDAVARQLCGPFAFCGVGIARHGAERFHIATAEGISAGPETLFRAASISKVVTGRVLALVQADAGLGEDAEVQDVLGVPFRNPAHPDLPVTVAQVVSHQAGLSDEGAGYAVPAGADLRDWIQRGDIWSDRAAGAAFEYCNLGYLIAAACAECIAGEPFDRLAARLVLEPLGIVAGFNWAGVAARSDTLATYRRGPEGLVPQIDAVVPERAAETTRPPFIAGAYVARFSPQGGLRISLRGALTLAQSLRAPQEVLWQADPARTIGPADVFGSYGWGVQMIDAPQLYPRPLVGHFANAYGMVGGVWWDAAREVAFTYALNGLPLGEESDEFSHEERALFAAIARDIEG